MKFSKELLNNPRFGFILVWIITVSLFGWAWHSQWLSFRDRALVLKSASIVEPIKYEGLKAQLAAHDSKLKVVHLWATWCEPCVREIGTFAQLQQKFSRDDVQLFLISADQASDLHAVEKFLKEHGIHFQTYILADNPTQFMKQLSPAWSGSLPATFLFNAGGALNSMLLGESAPGEIEAKIKGALEPKP